MGGHSLSRLSRCLWWSSYAIHDAWFYLGPYHSGDLEFHYHPFGYGPHFPHFRCAALYLGINQNMPITAVIFLIELSRWSIEYALPISLAMGLGLAVYYALKPYVLKEA